MAVDLISVITTTLAISGAVGGGASIFYASRSRNLITLLKDENAALLGSNTRLEKDLEVERTKRLAIENERDIWRDNVTQAPAIKELIESSAVQHKEVINTIGEFIKEMRAERRKK